MMKHTYHEKDDPERRQVATQPAAQGQVRLLDLQHRPTHVSNLPCFTTANHMIICLQCQFYNMQTLEMHDVSLLS